MSDMPTVNVKLSLSEKLHFMSLIVHAVILAVIAAVQQLLLPRNDPEYTGVSRRMFTVIMKGLTGVPSREKAVLMPMPSTSSAIKTWCTLNNAVHSVTPLPYSAALHWVGHHKSSKILIYIHGGGYNNPIIAPGHVPFAVRCAANASASLAMLEYSLSPEARYPSQLKQAVAALLHVLNDTQPSDITLAGDSAGSHLIAGLLSHILHPVKGVDVISLNGRFGGICFAFPFLSFNCSKPSFKENSERDYVTVEAIKQMIADFAPQQTSVAAAIRDPQLSPAEAPTGWWKGVPVERILIVYGAWEVVKDDVVSFGGRLEEDAGKETKIDVVQCAKEVHVACIIDQILGLKEREGGSTETILTWMSAATV